MPESRLLMGSTNRANKQTAGRAQENPAHSAKLAHCLAQQGAVLREGSSMWRKIFFHVLGREREEVGTCLRLDCD